MKQNLVNIIEINLFLKNFINTTKVAVKCRLHHLPAFKVNFKNMNKKL